MPLSSPPTLASHWASWEVLRTAEGLAGDGHPCDPPPPRPGVVPGANRQRCKCYLDLSFLIVPAFISLGEKRRGNPQGAAAGKGEEARGRSQSSSVKVWPAAPGAAFDGRLTWRSGEQEGPACVASPDPPQWMSSPGTASLSDTETAPTLQGKALPGLAEGRAVSCRCPVG